MIPRYRPSLNTIALGKALLGNSHASSQEQSLLPLSDLVFEPSASHGLLHSLLALKLKGLVVLPAYTCERVVAAVLAAGCQPKFVDIEPDSGTMSANGFLQALRLRPQAVVATHMFGIPCDIKTIVNAASEQGVLVIEDCALASGTVIEGKRAGEWGDIALFSFGLGKTVSLGYGGALKVNQSRLRAGFNSHFLNSPGTRWPGMATFGGIAMIAAGSDLIWRSKYQLIEMTKALLGRGSRAQHCPPKSTIAPDVLSATEGKILLRILSAVDQARLAAHGKQLGDIYRKKIIANPWLMPLTNRRVDHQPLYPSFPLRVTGRASLHACLRAAGFDSGLFFSYSAAEIYGDTGCPQSAALGREIICLPVHVGVSVEAADAIADVVNQWSHQQTN